MQIKIMSTKTPDKPVTMRNHWFDHVRKTRKKLSKGLPELISHRDAMTKASESWQEMKVKVKRKLDRDKRRAEKAAKS